LLRSGADVARWFRFDRRHHELIRHAAAECHPGPGAGNDDAATAALDYVQFHADPQSQPEQPPDKQPTAPYFRNTDASTDRELAQ
jgi:hypothetical protein